LQIVSRGCAFFAQFRFVYLKLSSKPSTSSLWRTVPRLAAVISSSGKPVSAKQNLSPPRSPRCSILRQLFGFALLLLPLPLRAQSPENAAHELAMKVCLGGHKQPVKVAWQEYTSSGAYFSDTRKKAFLDQISACGMEATEDSDVPRLTVTLRYTPSKALLIASLTEAVNGQQLFVVEIPRASLLVARESGVAPQLRGELLWSEEKQIQSAIGWQDPSAQERFLLVFGDGLVSRLRFENNAWKLMDSAELPGAGRRSRSGEGGFFYGRAKQKFELVLRKKVCELNLDGRLSLTCSGNEVPNRTAEIASTCEESPRYLVAGKGDYTQPDRITLGNAAKTGGAASAAPEESYSGSVEMPGPVLDISVAENSKTAFAVAKNLSTGNYEVYRITAVCSD
jgi:hypothetical protein